MDSHDTSRPKLAKRRQFKLGPNPTLLTDVPLTARNEHAIAHPDVVQVLDLVLAKRLQPLTQVADHAVHARVVLVDSGADTRSESCQLNVRRVGTTQDVADEVRAPVDSRQIRLRQWLPGGANEGNVLLRYCPCSISLDDCD
jgi:hypothetical protein